MSLASEAVASASTSTSADSVGFSFAAVTKRYGSLFALHNVTLNVAPGEFLAVLGHNGSGKSTLIKIAAQAAQPTAGSVQFAQHTTVIPRSSISAKPGQNDEESALPSTSQPLESAQARARIGLVAHSTLTYDDLSAGENLHFFAQLYGVQSRQLRVTDLLREVGLADRRASLARTFSRGMRQRLAIARALLPSPGLLLLDEPTTGLDADALAWLTNYLRDLHAAGCTIVLSTHGTSDVLALATRTITLTAGAISADSATSAHGGAA